VHLKRFNCVNGKWVKSQKVVHFPFDDFDPTPYLASVPQETILRHKELLELKRDLASNEIVSEMDEVDTSDKEKSKPIDTDVDPPREEASTTTKETPHSAGNVLRQSKSSNAARRQRLISTSLTKTPIVDGEFEDYHQHKLKADVDEFDPRYKLYAVVVSLRKLTFLLINSIYNILLFIVALGHAKWWSLHFLCIKHNWFLVLLQ